MHTVRKFMIGRGSNRKWVWAVMFVESDAQPGYRGSRDEIERFANAADAYSFCSWLNGGEYPNLTETSWLTIKDDALPSEDDE